MEKSKTPKLSGQDEITSKNGKSGQDEKIKHERDETLEHADALYKQVKNKACDIYENTVCEAHDQLKHHTDSLVKHVQEKPLSSLLIAGGVGFILSTLLRK
ncbi:MAG: hypothetical protein H0U57_10865 [Tatlockia sp.]|nr:hypothetical protein [Tatlockia sp.]